MDEEATGWEINFIVSRTDEGREHRLRLLLAYVQGALGLTYKQLASRIEEVEDHKGDLTVTWAIVPTDLEQEAFRLGWAGLGETRENVVQGWPTARPY